MKQLLLLFVAMLHLTAASAYDLTDDKGLYYNKKSDGTLEVVGLKTSATKADILSSVTISGQKYRITSIGERAFEGRSDLTYLSIPYSVKSIGKYAFMNCGKKISVNIADPESWCQMELGNEHSSPLSSAGKLLIHDIETNQVDIPKSVTSINAFTFYQCSCIKTLNIPASVKSIGSSAFEDCDNLTSLNLSEGLESIGGSAFEGCTNLKTLSIPSTVTRIKINAFKNCTSITDVFCLATKVPTTDEKAFDGTPTKQATLHIPSSAYDAYKATWPWSNFFDYRFVSASSDIIIGILGYRLNHEKKTAEVARCEKNMVSVEIPSTVTYGDVTYTVTSIGAYAFFDLKIESLTIPSCVTNIEKTAFEECIGLNPIKSYIENPTYAYFPYWVVENSTLYVPEGSLDKYKAVETWKDFKTIVTFNDDVTEAVVNNIRYRVNHKTKTAEVARCEKNNISVELPSSIKVDGVTYTVTSIGAYAFFDLTIGSLTIPSTVTNIDKKAFDECIGLNPIKSYIENPPYADFPYWVVDNSTLYVPEGCLEKYKAVESWKSFKHITTFNDDVTEEVVNNIRYRVNHKTKTAEVKRCEIKTVNAAVELPSTIKVNGVTYTVTSIGANAFFDLTIGSLTIPSTITNIDKTAFDECIGLDPITSYMENPPYAYFPYWVVDNSTLYVPEGCVEKYKAVETWKNFKKIHSMKELQKHSIDGLVYTIKEDEGVELTGFDKSIKKVDIPSSVTIDGTKHQVTSIAERAFEGRNDITYLSIPYSIKSIGAYAFINCGSEMTVNISDPEAWCQMKLGNEHSSPLSSAKKLMIYDVETDRIDIPKGVTSIGNFTFYQCSCITALTIPSTVESIGSSAFEDCDYLTSLSLSEGLETIGGSAFEGCKRLKSLSIPSTVTSIKLNAFKNCTGLEQVDCYAETVPELGENAFEGVWNKAALRVPYTVEGKYLKTSPWNQFSNITHLPYITYVIDGEVYDKVYVPFGTIIITPQVAEREGYEFSWGEYPKTMPDEDVTINGSYTPTGIGGIKAEVGEAEIYSINGYRTSKLQRGLNIIRQQDGKTRKVMVR